MTGWFAFDRDSRFSNTYNLPNQLVLLRRRLEDLPTARVDVGDPLVLFQAGAYGLSFAGHAAPTESLVELG